MESVIQQIRQHRENTKGQSIINSKEAVVNGCQVKFNFDETGNNKILPIVQTILASAYVDSLLVKVSKNIVVESNDDLIKHATSYIPHFESIISNLDTSNQKPSVIEQIREAKKASKLSHSTIKPEREKRKVYAEI